MELQFMKVYRSLLYFGLTGNEFMVYTYLLDKWQNVLDKYNNKILLDNVYHAEEQKSIAKKLHLSTRTLQNVLKSLEEKHMLKIACGKEFAEKNSYYMTDIRATECYKQLDDKYKYEYEQKSYTKSNTNSAYSSSSNSMKTTATRGAIATSLDNKMLDYKQVQRICSVLSDSTEYDFTFMDSIEVRNFFNLNDYTMSTVSFKTLSAYLKERYNIDITDIKY